MSRYISMIGTGCCLLTLSGGSADEPGSANERQTGRNRVRQLAFMTGRWSGRIFDDSIEEYWMSPASGAMLGMSRMGYNSSKATYESMLIEEDEDGVSMYLRHFNSGLATREDAPMRFHLVDVETRKARFEATDPKLRFSAIIYNLKGHRTLEVILEGGTSEKPLRIEAVMKRIEAD